MIVWAPSFSLLENHTKGRFVSVKVTPLPLCLYPFRNLLARWFFFKRLQNYMENEDEVNENKIIHGDFNCTQDKMDSYDRNKTKILYRCYSYYSFNVSNGLMIYEEMRTQIPLSSPTMIGPMARI